MPADPQMLNKETWGAGDAHADGHSGARTIRGGYQPNGRSGSGRQREPAHHPGARWLLRIYTPSSPPLVSFHGSSFVLCSLGTHDGMCRNLCAGADAEYDEMVQLWFDPLWQTAPAHVIALELH